MMQPRVYSLFALSLFVLFACSCSPSANKKPHGQSVSFNVLYKSSLNNGVVVAYTTDPDTIWSDSLWAHAVLQKMHIASRGNQTMLLFDSREHTPDVTECGMQYPDHYDQWMVAGYWKYATGAIQFCYGRKADSNNFEHCRSLRENSQSKDSPRSDSLSSNSEEPELRLLQEQFELLSQMQRDGFLRLEPNLNRAYVSPLIWADLDATLKDNLSASLAIYCGSAKGTHLYWVDIYDMQSGKRLAKYSHSWGFTVY